MQIKFDFLCRDSILGRPLVLDLIMFLDLAQRTLELRNRDSWWLSFLLQVP